METENSASTELARRELVKLSGAAVGGLAMGGAIIVGSAGAHDEQGTTAFEDNLQCMEGFS